MSIKCVSFRGGESTGSVGYTNNVNLRNTEQPTPQMPSDSVNFRGYDEYGQKKKSKAVPIIIGTLALAAAAIGGMGYAGKVKALDKLKDGKIKDLLLKTEPMLNKCHEWCSAVKKFGVDSWDKVKGWFGNKKS